MTRSRLSDITLHRFVRPISKKMATWTDHAPTTEPQRRPIGIVCEPRREQMRMKATLSLAIGLCVACVAILIALHVLEPEFNPPHLISEYQLGRFGWLMSLAFFCLGAASFALFVAARQEIHTKPGRFGT